MNRMNFNSCYFFSCSRRMPILTIKNESVPKMGERSPIFKPVAKISGETLPCIEMASKAPVKPISKPKNPQTSTNKLRDLILLKVFLLSSF